MFSGLVVCAFVRVCRLEELEADSPFHFEYDGRHFVVVRRGEEVFVLDGVCTHEYAELWRGFVTDDVITCPLHLSQFNVRTGGVVTPPAEQPLQTYEVKVENGEVWANI